MNSLAGLCAAASLVLSQAAVAGLDLQDAGARETMGVALAVALADIDRDGIADVVSSGTTGTRIHFSASATTRDATEQPFSALAVADLDGNGTADIAGMHYGADAVTVLLLEAGGEEVGRYQLATGGSPSAIALAHLNADAYHDIAVANADDDNLSIYLSNGAGSHDAAITIPAGNHPVALAVADFDADGNDDVYVLNMAGSTISLLAGDGNGSLEPQGDHAVPKDASHIDNSSLPVDMAMGDVNGDGMPDLVTASMLGNALRVHVNDGDGTFSGGDSISANWYEPALHLTMNAALSDPDATIDVAFGVGAEEIAAFPRALAMTDMDEDGRTDLVVAAVNRKSVIVFPGTLTGFGAGVSFPLESVAWSLAQGDVIGDERGADVVVAMPDVARIAVMENLDSAGWPPAAISGSMIAAECSALDGQLAGDDADGESLTYEILAVEFTGASGTDGSGAGGIILIGDIGDGDTDGASGDISITGFVPALVLTGIDPVSGAFTLDAGDTGDRLAAYWNLHFRVTDAGGASSEGDIRVTVTGDGQVSCPLAIETPDGDGEIVVTPGDDEHGEDLVVAGPTPVLEPDVGETAGGGGALNAFLLFLLAAARRRRTFA